MTELKKNILLLITELTMGGAEKVFAEHAKAFSQFYHVVECVYTKKGLSPDLVSGNKLVELDDKYAGGPLQRFIYREERLKKVCDEEGIEVCISHMDGANWLNVICNRNKRRTIVCIHGSLSKDKGRGKYLKKILLNNIIVPYIYKRADAVVCVSDHIKYELESLVGKRSNIHSIPNFFDIPKIRSLAGEPLPSALSAILAQSHVFVAVGRLAPEKNYGSLVKAISAFKKLHTTTKLFFIGEGGEEPAIITAAQKEGLTCCHVSGNAPPADATIYLMGLMQNPYKIIARCSALLVSSYNEGFPLVVVEAMICSTPVVSYDCISGPKQILAPELKQVEVREVYFGRNGILLPPQQEDEISEPELDRWCIALDKIASDQTYRATVIASAEVRAQEFSKENVISRWKNLIEGKDIDK